MNRQENPFLSGSYHRRRARELLYISNLATQNEQNLGRVYRHAEALIYEQNWQHPLELEQPDLLLMGLEGAATAQTFINFARSRNSFSAITVADFSEHPLIQCKESGIDDIPNITLVQADTTALHFLDNSFDMIETDGFLQFLSPAQKRQAIAEWFRVLRPGGVMTTRDRFVSITESPEKWDDLTSWRQELDQRLGVFAYPTTLEVMGYLFTHQGFEVVYDQVYPNARGAKGRLIYGIAARKPLEPSR